MHAGLLRLWRLGRSLVAAPPVAPAHPTRRRRRKPKRPRDFQRSRVYRWEGEHVLPRFSERLSLEDCEQLIAAAYRWYEAIVPGQACAPPRLTDGRGRRHACGSREVIKLPRWARTPPIVLHECAHGMADDQHGPGFVAVYVALLERFLGLDAAALRVTLAASHVQVASAPDLTRFRPADVLPRRD